MLTNQSPLPVFVILLGAVGLFVGYYFLAKSRGQEECADPKPSDTKRNYIGGVVGAVTGVVFIIVGLVLMMFATPAPLVRPSYAPTPNNAVRY
jgi:uncharacterized membrane protein YfcA